MPHLLAESVKVEPSLERAAKPIPLSWTTLASAAVLIRLCYWGYTHRVWEDALITLLHSENAVLGIGLTHYHLDGIPVHGFTSPLSVLIPLLGDLIHLGLGLPLLKLLSAIAAGWTVLLGMSIARDLRFPSPLAWMVGGYLAFEHHQILWGMAGMETQVVTALLLFSFWCLIHPRPVRLGLAMALCMLARPDFGIWLVVMALFICWRAYRANEWRPLLTIAVVFLLLYGPWVVFTTLYYGSPIPNTILAKSAGYPAWWTYHYSPVAYIRQVAKTILNPLAALGPVYGGHGTGFYLFDKFRIIELSLLFLLGFGFVAAVRKRDWDALPIFSFVLVFCLYFTFLVPAIFGWYTVPYAAAALICSAYGINQLLIRIENPHTRNRLARYGVTAYLAVIVCILPFTFTADRNIQIYIEDGVRKQMALYINRNSKPTDTIGCEPLGYMSYYTRRMIFDYPGLVNRDIVRFLRNNPDKRGTDFMLAYTRPTWIVLRKEELDESFVNNPRNQWLYREYSMIREFKADPAAAQKIPFLDRNRDTDYFVFRKNAESGSTEPSTRVTWPEASLR